MTFIEWCKENWWMFLLCGLAFAYVAGDVAGLLAFITILAIYISGFFFIDTRLGPWLRKKLDR